MILKQLLLLVGVLMIAVHALREETVSAGIITATRVNSDYRLIFLNSFLKLVQKYQIKDKTWIIPIKKLSNMNLNATFYNFKLSKASIDEAGTTLEFLEEEPHVKVTIKDISFNFEFEYNITSDPELISDVGKGTLVIDNLSMKGAGQPQVDFQGNTLQHLLELDDISISCDSFTAQLEGGDLALVINGLSGIVTAFIREYVLKTFDDKMRTSLSEFVNTKLVRLPHTFDTASQGHLIMDYNLVKEGIKVTDEFVSVLLDGTYYPSDYSEDQIQAIERDFDQMPFFRPQGSDFQIMVSEYSIESLLKAYIDGNELKFNTTLSSETVGSLINDFERVFGDHDEVLMIFQAKPTSDFKPQVNITTSQTTFKFEIEILVMNPYDNDTVAMVLTTQISADMQFAIDDDFKITGHAEDVESNFTKIDSYFKTSLTEAKMNGRVGVVHAFMIAFVNKALDDGFQLPMPKDDVGRIVKQPRIRMFDKYLFIDAQPIYDYGSKHTQVQQIKQIESEINSNTIYAEQSQGVKFLNV